MIVGKFNEIKVVPKSWGKEVWFWNESYCGKELHINKDFACSWHYHLVKDEVFRVLEGELLVFYGWEDDIGLARSVKLVSGDLFHVPPGLRHQMRALKDTKLIEFSTHHEDEDSIRLIKS